MGLGSIIVGSIAGAVSAAANAAKNNSSKNNSGGSSSGGNRGSSSTGGKGSTTGGSYQYGNYLNDSGRQTITSKDAAAWQAGADQAAANWHNATTPEDKEYWHNVAIDYNTRLGKSYDDATGKWSGGYVIADPNPYEGALGQYQDYMQQAADQQQAAIQAGVDSAVAGLNAQKGEVGKLTEKNNAAAEKAYMQTVKPNGSLAESLAANGLLSTGATESSQIAAGNSYQNALNSNATTEAEAIAEIERAITQAQLSGDLQAAQALSGILTQIAEKGYQNVQDIAQWDQWNKEFGYNQAVTDAGLTGIYNGQTTMQGQAAQDEHTLNQLSAESQRIANEISAKTGLTLAQLQIEALRLQNEGYTLDNAYKALQNKYANYQLGGM